MDSPDTEELCSSSCPPADALLSCAQVPRSDRKHEWQGADLKNQRENKKQIYWWQLIQRNGDKVEWGFSRVRIQSNGDSVTANMFKTACTVLWRCRNCHSHSAHDSLQSETSLIQMFSYRNVLVHSILQNDRNWVKKGEPSPSKPQLGSSSLFSWSGSLTKLSPGRTRTETKHFASTKLSPPQTKAIELMLKVISNT